MVHLWFCDVCAEDYCATIQLTTAYGTLLSKLYPLKLNCLWNYICSVTRVLCSREKKFAGCVFLERRLFYRCIDLKSLKWHIIMLKSLASCANNVYTSALDLFIQLPLKRFDITIFFKSIKKIEKILIWYSYILYLYFYANFLTISCHKWN